MNRIASGRHGEDQAAVLLTNKGYTILERNYRSGRWGEIDLVCLDRGDLVFVEVKARKSVNFGQPVEAVSWGKRQRLMHAAQQYKLTHPKTPESMRFDVVAVTLSDLGSVKAVELYQNIDHG